jgi:hypothetical protein
MLEKVKKELANQKEKLEPISLRIESSSKTALSMLSASYDVKSNELVRIILKAFIEEALNEPLNKENIQKNTGDDEEIAFDTLGELLDFLHPEHNPSTRILKQGFRISVQDKNLGDKV